ncbi:MAG TPA: hypothetical protein VIJ40_09030 [Acidimicrobiales bacterium]
MKTLPNGADSIGFVSLAVKEQQLAHELAFYKDNYTFDVRFKTIVGLTALLWRWLKHHEICVARAARVSEFQIVTTIPSTRNRESHPLSTMVGEKIGVTLGRYQPLLEANSNVPDNREYLPNRFLISGKLEANSSVLLIDDTFTRGSRVQAAATALKDAGANKVGVVCIGRHFSLKQDGGFGTAARTYYKRSLELGWDWERCCLCTE